MIRLHTKPNIQAETADTQALPSTRNGYNLLQETIPVLFQNRTRAKLRAGWNTFSSNHPIKLTTSKALSEPWWLKEKAALSGKENKLAGFGLPFITV